MAGQGLIRPRRPATAPEVLGGTKGFLLAGGRRHRAKNTSPQWRGQVAGGQILKVMREGNLMKTAFWLMGAAALTLSSPALAGDSIKIGFISTFSGPTA